MYLDTIALLQLLLQSCIFRGHLASFGLFACMNVTQKCKNAETEKQLLTLYYVLIFGVVQNPIFLYFCRDNLLTHVHKDVSRCTLLRELHLQGNKLTLLPPQITECKELIGDQGVILTWNNPWIQPIKEQANVSNHHLIEYLKSFEFSEIYKRNI